LLDEKYSCGEISSKTSWLQFQNSVTQDSRYMQMKECSFGSSASDLFQDFIDSIHLQYKKDKKKVKIWIKESNISIYPGFQLEDFLVAIVNNSSYEHVDGQNLKQIFEEFDRIGQNE